MIYQFPVQRTCFVCPHHEDREDGPGLLSWCSLIDEEIDSEVLVAENCSLFEVDPTKVRTER